MNPSSGISTTEVMHVKNGWDEKRPRLFYLGLFVTNKCKSINQLTLKKNYHSRSYFNYTWKLQNQTHISSSKCGKKDGKSGGDILAFFCYFGWFRTILNPTWKLQNQTHISARCPRTDLNKRLLPKPMTTTGWKGTPKESKSQWIEILLGGSQ